MAASAESEEDDTEFRIILNYLSEELDSENVKDLIFLLSDAIPRLKLENVVSGNDVFELLIKSEKMSWQTLEELLDIIKRIDLKKRFLTNSSESLLALHSSSESWKPSALRKLMYRMGKDIDESILEKVVFVENLSKRDELNCGLNLLDYFMKVKPICSIREIPEKLKDHCDLLNLYHRYYGDYEDGRISEDSGDVSRQYRRRWSSLFPTDNLPTFPTEYSQSTELTINNFFKKFELPGGIMGCICSGTYKARPVAVKSLYNPDTARKKDLQMIAYLRHPFLLSIIKAEFSDIIRLVYCPEARMKMTLSNLLKGVCHLDSQLDEQKKRIKILYQISDALSFLHMPVGQFRGPVVHMDVKPHNIFLDRFHNALLGDVDTAVEIPDEATHRSVEGVESDGYSDWYKKDKRKQPSNDIFSLGIVALQVLKWQPASEANGNKWKLFESVSKLHKSFENATMDQIEGVVINEDFIDQSVWDSQKGLHQLVGQMALKCLLRPENRITADQCAASLRDILINNFCKLWDFAKGDRSCIQCHFFEISDTLKITSDVCTKDCMFYNKFCRECHYFSFRNPLHCPNHGIVYPMIGSPRNFVILISGFDHDDCQYKAFQQDIDYVRRIVTDPRVMNIRLENLLEVRKGSIENFTDLEEQVRARMSEPMDFLFLYYSGHSIKEEKIRVTECEDSVIDVRKLRELLGGIQFKRLLVLFDCCYAASTDLSPISPRPISYEWMIFLYSSDAYNPATCNTDEGSLFTRYFLAGLQSAQVCVCQNIQNCEKMNRTETCPALEKFRTKAAKTGLIELNNLISYLSDPIHETVRKKPKIHKLEQRSVCDKSGIAIAYYNEDFVVYNFRFIHQSSKLEIPIQLEQIDHSATLLADAVLDRLSEEIEKYAPITNAENVSNLRLESEAGREVTTVEEFKKLAMRNECFKVYIC